MDATFWATVALVIFVGVVLYLKVPGMLSKSLDDRADRIRAELEDARKLREEAQQLLAEYQRKRKEAEKEASEIVESAKREAGILAEEAHKKTEEYVARRTALAEQKIGQAEREAINEVRANAVDLAVEAARQVLAGKADAKTNAELFKGSVQELKAKLN
ncbi:F0F1 ATP synthase subunit B [Aminobacter aganoensis]|uniref:ATP synthase subunit b n=1 Tax=Aminobacter aganoensis TaxID=83264 RepID=A0A7X0F5Z7_9HYPH|nr:F0F1 ATP synthase subunit B [Aminobacter aganoensis]MBB6353660.1 F-type H+-transporting ATPase subunit b [Aminobacter aganoensis]